MEKELEEVEQITPKQRKIFFLSAKKFWLIFFVFIFFVFILPFSLYFSYFLRSFFSSFLKRIPYPVAWVEGTGLISSKDLLSNLEAVKIFYRSEDFASQGLRVDFSTQAGKDRLKIKEKDILDKLVEDAIVKKIAQKKGIEITKEMAEKDILEKVNQAGNDKTFILNLKQNYDWGLADFRDKVVIPQLYLKALAKWFEENDKTGQASQEEIKKVKEKLDSKGENFSELAKKYSQGESAKMGGDLGWFKKEELVAEVAEKVFQMKVGEFSEIIESPLGWHLVFLEEERESEKDGKKSKEVKIKQIFFNKGNFIEWLMKEKSAFNVSILVRDYFWNKESAEVQFRDYRMKERENNLRVLSEGDPSL